MLSLLQPECKSRRDKKGNGLTASKLSIPNVAYASRVVAEHNPRINPRKTSLSGFCGEGEGRKKATRVCVCAPSRRANRSTSCFSPTFFFFFFLLLFLSLFSRQFQLRVERIFFPPGLLLTRSRSLALKTNRTRPTPR